MKKTNKKISNKVVYAILVTIVFILGVLAQIVLNTSMNNDVVASLEYVEDASVSYRVYYSENPFYTEPYIEEGKTYIQEYVDKITAGFSYEVNYTDDIKRGDYEYYVQAKLIAYNSEDPSEDLWTKEYKLTDLESVSVKDDSNYRLFKSVDVDYQFYRREFLNYKNSLGVNVNAKLVVEMVINNRGNYPNLDDFEYGSWVKLEMPLDDATFKIKTNSSVNQDTHKIVKFSETDHEELYIRVIGILLLILCGFAGFVLVLFIVINKNKLSYYERVLRKILITHDRIIVNVEKLPVLDGVSVVEVTDFDELLDAQGEVRLPINFKEDKKRKIAKFILISDNLAWVYTLREGDLNEDTK